MTDQSVDLLAGEAPAGAPLADSKTADTSTTPHVASSENTTPPTAPAVSVDLLGFGDAQPQQQTPTTQSMRNSADFDVFASPPPSDNTNANDPATAVSSEAPSSDPQPASGHDNEMDTPRESSSENTTMDCSQPTTDYCGDKAVVPNDTPHHSKNKSDETPESSSSSSSSSSTTAAPPTSNHQPTMDNSSVETTTVPEDQTNDSTDKQQQKQQQENKTNVPPTPYNETPVQSAHVKPQNQDSAAANESDQQYQSNNNNCHAGVALDASTNATTCTESKSCNDDKTAETAPAVKETTLPTKQGHQTETNESLTGDQLRQELQEAKAEIERLRNEQSQRMEDDGALLMELQSKLQEHMSARAEAENKVRLTEQTVESLTKTNQEQAAELEKYNEIEKNWDSQKTDKAEMENDLHAAKKQISKLEEEKEALRELISNLETEVQDSQRERLNQEEEMKMIREQRDDQERREIALTNRLNAAKKKEADKANLAEHFEDEMKALRDDAAQAKSQAAELTEANAILEEEVARIKSSSETRIRQAELALADEKRLNEDRKGKMKAFIEKKSEELRQARADADSMQTELNQTSRSLVDLNNRWKQLHAQWVQSQTRNRELQRDLNRIKKDSENLHKVGDTLEMKLSRSATETEEHKNKRLAAKNELMTVLKTLEAEREVSARLRDAIKFTFTPKALSQQQLLKENLEEFENELLRLARRFGKPLPPVSGGGLEASERSLSNGAGGDEGAPEEDGRASRADADIQRLIAKLDHETQGVSQHIMALTNEIERLHMLIDVSGSRNCYTTLSDIILGSHGAATSDEGRGSVAESSVPLRAIRSHQYGQVPNAAT